MMVGSFSTRRLPCRCSTFKEPPKAGSSPLASKCSQKWNSELSDPFLSPSNFTKCVPANSRFLATLVVPACGKPAITRSSFQLRNGFSSRQHSRKVKTASKQRASPSGPCSPVSQHRSFEMPSIETSSMSQQLKAPRTPGRREVAATSAKSAFLLLVRVCSAGSWTVTHPRGTAIPMEPRQTSPHCRLSHLPCITHAARHRARAASHRPTNNVCAQRGGTQASTRASAARV
mmetsp:Transcript_176343/g.560154  ORF Transcript_176343/g.560154 Transcript_176343/m.560154 type:complete len:231 (+) Transcript_176343:595-1287(+)